MITVERLREVLNYDPDTGIFTWRKPNRYAPVKAGSTAGWQTERGYWRIRVDGRVHRAHRLAWLYMTGAWPFDQTNHVEIDHINNNGIDNCWANLRLASKAQNNANSRRYKSNTSGFKGVTWDATRGKWQAHISINYKRRRLGRYDTTEAAAAAYANAAHEHWGEFTKVA